MKITFSCYQFDCESRLLLEGDEIIPLSDKSTQLLVLFLLNGDKVHSKVDILDFVWPDRVVTDQVVFQSISQLRALFGSESIRTFSKKGYQWQIPVSKVDEASLRTVGVVSEKPINPIDIETSERLLDKCNVPDSVISKSVTNTKKGTIFPFVIAIVCFVIFFTTKPEFIFSTSNESESRVLLLLSENFIEGASTEGQVSSLLLSNSNINQLNTDKSNRLTSSTLFDSPFEIWEEYSQSEEQLLLSYKLYLSQGSAQDEMLMRFLIQGKNRGWQGYIIGRTVGDVTAQLTQLLETIQSTSYFSLDSEKAALAQLVLLQNVQSDNPIFTLQLVQQYFELEDFDNANALFDEAIMKPQHPLYLGLFHFIKTKISMRNSDWEKAQQYVDITIEKFSTLRVPQLKSKALIEAAWVSIAFAPHTESIEYLNLAAHKARVANEPIQELQAHVVQLYLAAKNNEPTLMYAQMDQAQQLISLHKLHREHEIAILYFMASGVNYLTEKKDVSSQELFYYQKILASPFSKLYSSFFYDSAEFVRDKLIKQHHFKEATASIKPWQRSSFANISRAKITYAQGNNELAVNYAIQAFTEARITHALYDSLDAALLLVRYNKNSEKQFDDVQYIEYILKNSTKRWRRINNEILGELGYWRTL